MLENLTNKLIIERNKLIDKCTIKLLERAGITLSKDYSETELLMCMNDLHRYGYTIKFVKSCDEKDKLYLSQNGALICGYEFDIRVESNCIKIIVIPIE